MIYKLVFNDLESLWKYVQKEIKEVMKDEVVEAIKEVEQETIQEVVLDTYTPSYYDRRSEESNGEEGLMSRDNMVADYVETRDSIQVNITNDTRGNPDYPNSTSGYIDEMVEYGEYTWKNSEIYKKKLPRPFTKITQKKIDESDIVVKTIKNNIDFEIK